MTENNKIIDVEQEEVEEVIEDTPTLEKGNYILEITSEGNVIRKLAIANSSIKITKLADGGMTVDLK